MIFFNAISFSIKVVKSNGYLKKTTFKLSNLMHFIYYLDVLKMHVMRLKINRLQIILFLYFYCIYSNYCNWNFHI